MVLPLTDRKRTPLPWRAGVPSTVSTSFEVGGGALNILQDIGIWGNFITPSREDLNIVLHDVTQSGVRLGNTTNNVSTFRKYRKYALQRLVIEALQGMNMRVDNCLKAVKREVSLLKDAQGHVRASGVMLCGSVWVCPVCASRITEARRQELAYALRSSGLFPVMVTVTLQHDKRDSLGDLLDALNTSLRKLKQGRGWKEFTERYGITAYASSLEVTYSRVKGFHPHKHYLFFLDSKDIDLDAFRDEISGKYVQLVEKCGRYASEYHAIDVQAGDGAVGDYISKWGIASEMTSSDTKEARGGSYSMWALAELSHTEQWARDAFREYARATFGKRALVYSKGGREVLGIGAEVEGEAEAEALPEVIAVIPREVWAVVHRFGLVGDLLYLAEKGGAVSVKVLLDSLPKPGGRSI